MGTHSSVTSAGRGPGEGAAVPAPVRPCSGGAAGTQRLLPESVVDREDEYGMDAFSVTFRLPVCVAMPSTRQIVTSENGAVVFRCWMQ